MDITNDIKAKVFAQYLGQKFHLAEKNRELQVYGITTFGVVNVVGEVTYALDKVKPILKPLSAITDEDAIEMANLFGGITGSVTINRPTDLTNTDIHFTVQIHQGEKDTWKSFCVPKYISANTPNGFCQFLISKGYDIPNYLLQYKTLHQAGLAIY